MSINKAIRQVAALAVQAYTEFSDTLYKAVRIAESENRLASVAQRGCSFVSAFRVYKDDDLPDTYISMVEEMLAAGVDDADVLYYFEKRKGKR
jgi:hypothetical protein